MNATRFLSIPDSHFERAFKYVAVRRGKPTGSGCIPWTGAKDRHGYGRICLNRFFGEKRLNTSAHRLAWIIENGPINNSELVIDHLCRNRICVNVRHLELVSNRTNVQRGALPVANRKLLGLPSRITRSGQSGERRETCRYGHPWVRENIYTRTTKDGYVSRSCKTCARDRVREWKKRNSA